MSELTTNCLGIKSGLLAFLEQQVEVSADEGACIISLPLKTLDGRYIEVHIEPTVSDVVLVHDAGHAVAELYLQGIHMSEARTAVLKAIAKSYNASFSDGTFTAIARPTTVSNAVLAIAQCASLAMYEVLKHVPVVQEDNVATIVRQTMESYAPQDVETRYNLTVRGNKNRQHIFDAVAFPRTQRRNPVAVKTLGSGYSPSIQSRLYGFLALDLEGTEFDNWPRIAVISKAERWPDDLLGMVKNMSARTLELKTGEDGQIRERLPGIIDELANAA